MSTVDLILTAFEQDISLSLAAQLIDPDITMDVSATIELTTDVSADVLSRVFYYKTDDLITSLPTDSSAVQYYVDKSLWADFESNINPFRGTVTENYFRNNTTDNIGKDFLRELARQLFGTTLGVDLFTNEDAVSDDISARCDIVASAINTKLVAVDICSGTHAGMAQDASDSDAYYLKDDTSDTNICRELLIQMLDVSGGSVDRFVDISTNYAYPGKPAGYYRVPFVKGDTISYKLTVSPSADQRTKVATGSTVLNDRTYRIKLKLDA
jgi:hypothetical protein